MEELLFQVSDVFGNTVSLTLDRWRYIQKHPELRGRDEALRAVMRQPTMVSQSSEMEQRFIFDGYGLLAPTSNIVRVVVQYNTSDIKKGSGAGKVITAYGPLHAGTGNVGKLIYFSGTARRSL